MTNLFEMVHMDKQWSFIVLMFFCCCALGQVPTRSAVIVDYGTYTADVSASDRNADGVLQSVINAPKISENTAAIYARPGVLFGFRFRIEGEPSREPLALREIVRYPKGGIRPPKTVWPIQFYEGDLSVSVDELSLAWYRFDDSWELVPGTWTIELWSGKQKLAEQVFNVITGASARNESINLIARQ